MAKSTILKLMQKFLVKVLWPWFKDYIWPVLKEHLLEIVSWAFATLKEKFNEYFEQQSNHRQEQAKRKAKQAEESAQKTSDEAERKTYEAVAKVWREVAEQFREENNSLKAKIQELTLAAENDISKRTRESDPTINFSNDQPVLLLGDKRTDLPALPSSNDY